MTKKILTISVIILVLTGVAILIETFRGGKTIIGAPGATPYEETWTPVGVQDSNQCTWAKAGKGCSYPGKWEVTGKVGEAGNETYYSETWTAQYTKIGCAALREFQTGWDYWSFQGVGCGYPGQWSVTGNVDVSPPSPPTTEIINTSGGGVVEVGWADTCEEWINREYTNVVQIGVGECGIPIITQPNVCVYRNNCPIWTDYLTYFLAVSTYKQWFGNCAGDSPQASGQIGLGGVAPFTTLCTKIERLK